jgi:dimethylhistidine N-methyltransferase
LAAWIGRAARIVEFGSGSGEKTRVLLARADDVVEYVPIDISQSQLLTFARDLGRSLPWLQVRPVCADYTRELALPAPARPCARTVVFFPGSTIGNFEPLEARAFLRNAAAICGPGGGLLIGVDLRKDRTILERAYNDAQGITAAFNLNMLTHINRVCDADFDVSAFAHRAIYDEARGRIEMHLISGRRQLVTLARSLPRPTRIHFDADEAILTEYSYKYDISEFQALAAQARFAPAAVWTDSDRRFSVHAFDVI